jgi:DNA recombination protein RmuC
LQLIEYGLQQKVLVASQITLIALLTTVAHSWRQDALNENYREVARLGREFYDRLSIFAGHFDEIRKKLDGAVQAYNDAAGSLESRVMVSARRLRELQVTTGAEIPTAEPVERTPRLLKQMELIEEAQGLRAKAQAGPEA